ATFGLNMCRNVVMNPVIRGRIILGIITTNPKSEKPAGLIAGFAYNGRMLDGAKFLSADQFLLTTLIVKLAVMAVLATMLARYRRFRHILIFERRGWLDRLVFTLALGIPLMAGVTARLLLNYKAADLTLEG